MVNFNSIKQFFAHWKQPDGIDRTGESPLCVENWRLKDSPERPECVPKDSPDIKINKTESGVEFVITPDARFENLPGYKFTPHYEKIDGLRMHYADEGPKDGEIILMLHGQPSWSYLYRKMIPGLSVAGFRVIAVDLIGMGKSDKPVDIGIHTYEWHVSNLKKFIYQLGLKDITLFCQDWGGLIGLRVAGDQPELFARIIAANTSLPVFPKGKNPFKVPNPIQIDCTLSNLKREPGNQGGRIKNPMNFQKWILFTLTSPDFGSGSTIAAKTVHNLTPDEIRAYDAPFPSFIYKAAPRVFPSMIAGVDQHNVTAWNNLGKFTKPFLFLAGELDIREGSSVKNQRKLTKHIPGAKGQPHERFKNANHYIQEDIGELLAEKVIKFIGKDGLDSKKEI
jgi:haloalkane dehalogenase